MITMRIKGGLGNQLFQYAAGYSFARRLDQKLQLDISFFPLQTLRGYKLDKLMIDESVTISKTSTGITILKEKYLNKVLRLLKIAKIPAGSKTKFLLETGSYVMDFFFKENPENAYLDGYFQSERYFRDYRADLLRQFTPSYEPEQEYLDALQQIRFCNSVAVHVRRGDFLHAQSDPNPRHYLLGETYYHNALKYITEQVESPEFFWFSDDIEWVKHNFGEAGNFHFISLKTKHGDIDEMMLMKNCHHIIAANSTFSWWGAWLNEYDTAIKTVPAQRYGNEEMIPETWKRITVEKQ